MLRSRALRGVGKLCFEPIRLRSATAEDGPLTRITATPHFPCPEDKAKIVSPLSGPPLKHLSAVWYLVNEHMESCIGYATWASQNSLTAFNLEPTNTTLTNLNILARKVEALLIFSISYTNAEFFQRNLFNRKGSVFWMKTLDKLASIIQCDRLMIISRHIAKHHPGRRRTVITNLLWLATVRHSSSLLQIRFHTVQTKCPTSKLCQLATMQCH